MHILIYILVFVTLTALIVVFYFVSKDINETLNRDLGLFGKKYISELSDKKPVEPENSKLEKAMATLDKNIAAEIILLNKRIEELQKISNAFNSRIRLIENVIEYKSRPLSYQGLEFLKWGDIDFFPSNDRNSINIPNEPKTNDYIDINLIKPIPYGISRKSIAIKND